MKILFLTIIIALLTACSGQGPKTSAKISFSSKQFVYGSNDELILYAINKDKNEQRTVILSEMSINMDLDFGNWELCTKT